MSESAGDGGGGGGARNAIVGRKICLVGAETVDPDLLHKLREADSELFTWQMENTEFGCDAIPSMLKCLKHCEFIVLILSKDTFTCNSQTGCLDIYLVLMAIANLQKTPHSVILKGISVNDLPLGFQRLKEPILLADTDEKDIENVLPKLKDQINARHRALADVNVGNAAQGQAWSNFYGFFNFMLPELKTKLGLLKQMILDKNKSEKAELVVFEKFVEVVWMETEGDLVTDISEMSDEIELLNIMELLRNIYTDYTDEDIQMADKKLMVFKARCGAKERPYRFKFYKVPNKDKNNAYVFAGQVAPSGKVFHTMYKNEKIKFTKEDSDQQRTCYAATSQRIADHLQNPACTNTLLVLCPSTADKHSIVNYIVKAIEEDISKQKPSELTQAIENITISQGSTDKFTKCFILYESDVNARVLEDTKCLLEQHKIVCTEQIIGSQILDCALEENDLLVCLITPQLMNRVQDFQAQISSLAAKKPYSKILIVKADEDIHDNDIRCMQFIYESTKFNDPLDCKHPEFLEKMESFLKGGPQSLLDKILISNIYTGLAWAFLYNYLRIQVPKLLEEAKNLKTSPKLYELIPLSGKCCTVALDKLAEHARDIIQEEGNRPYTTPIYTLRQNDRKVEVFMEYCTPVKVMAEMVSGQFAGLFKGDLHKQIRKFEVELQTLISLDDQLNNIVTLIAFNDSKEGELKKKLDDAIKQDYQL